MSVKLDLLDMDQDAGCRKRKTADNRPERAQEIDMKKTALALAVAALAANTSLAADSASIDWSGIPVRKVKMFYPGQASYEWLQSKEHKKGDRAIAQGRSCTTCHEDDQADLGNRLAKGTSNEATPIAGKKGTLELNVQAAHDDKFLYLRFQWATQNSAPGDAYPQLRFDGKEWKRYGGPRLDKDVRAGKMQAIYEDRLSIMLDDGKVPNFANQGCWQTCHDGMRDAPKQATAAAVQANPLLKALNKNDVRKYLPSTRTDALASWDKGKSLDEIAKIKAAGGFLDLTRFDLPGAKRFAVCFCTQCGTRVPHRIPGTENYLVPAGILDSSPDARPSGSIFWSSRAPWYLEPGERPIHEEYEK